MKKILIVFTDIHLTYSPTISQLYKDLKQKFETYIIAPEPIEAFSPLRIDDPNVIYFNDQYDQGNHPLAKRLFLKIKRYLFPPDERQQIRNLLMSPKAKKVISFIETFKGDVIAVDFLGLWCSQQVFKHSHFVSLEIHKEDLYRNNCKMEDISSVLIQSEERYKYLFGNLQMPKYIVQNAPPYINFKPDYSARSKYDLIYCGSSVAWFGVFSCLDFLLDFPEYNLTLKGALPKSTKESIDLFYQDLIKEKRLIIDQEYLDADELSLYVSKFRIGFAFYDFYRFEHVRTFNYFTAPSGKVFQYLNSGLPVIANKLPGFSFIEEREVGKLVSHLSSVSIKKAIDEIEICYLKTAEKAKAISAEFDIKKQMEPFIENIARTNRETKDNYV